MSARYSDRIILFDAPPLLATTEAAVLAHLVGQILLVVEAGKTPESVIKESISLLDKDKVIGTVLNKSRRSFGGGYYGGYYGKDG
jgi:Mrp family chromosome partitioning ATPase